MKRAKQLRERTRRPVLVPPPLPSEEEQAPPPPPDPNLIALLDVLRDFTANTPKEAKVGRYTFVDDDPWQRRAPLGRDWRIGSRLPPS